jgi:iron complex outermembrane receptor protein
MNRFKHVAMLSSVAISAISMPAMAQDSAQPVVTPELGEIVVTAQRRSEKVTKVPISITVADGAQLERQQVNTVNDLSRIAPSLEIQSAPGQNTGGGGSIRGIGTQTFSAGAVASVGVVVDQVSQGNANISNLFDVARVEVLKGPQGTLFGLTTSAGVINITTNKPEFDKFSARVRTELSGAGFAGSKSGNQVMQGVVNVPLASNAALRVAGFGNLRQGPDYDVTTGKYVSNNTWGLRGHLLWEPTSNLTVNLIGDYTKTRTTNGGDFFTFVKASGAGAFPLAAGVPDNVAGNLASCGVTAAEGNRNFCTSQNYIDRSYSGGASLQIDYAADPFTITSITAYRKSLNRAAARPPMSSAAIRCCFRSITATSTARSTCSPRNCASPRPRTGRWNIPAACSSRIRSRAAAMNRCWSRSSPRPACRSPCRWAAPAPSASPIVRWPSLASPPSMSRPSCA